MRWFSSSCLAGICIVSLSAQAQGTFSNNYVLQDGYQNTVAGEGAFFQGIAGFASSSNSAFGYEALYSHDGGQFDNSAFGVKALYSNVIGGWNTAFGSGALYSSTGSYNTGLGANAGAGSPGLATGEYNTAVGWDALEHFTYGGSNTAIGEASMFNNTGGSLIPRPAYCR